MNLKERLFVEIDAIAGMLMFILLSILFFMEWIKLPQINLGLFLLPIFVTLLIASLASFPIFFSLNPKIFKIIKKKNKERLLNRTSKTPKITSLFGIFISLIYIFYINKYFLAFNIGLLTYALLSLAELFRFIYYMKIELIK